MSVLREGRWNQAAFDVLNENAAIVRMLERCRDELVVHQTLSDEILVWRDTTIPPLLACAAPRTFDEANAINRALRLALTQFISLARSQPGLAAPTLRASLANMFLLLNIGMDT
jgi:hypothetical protein